MYEKRIGDLVGRGDALSLGSGYDSRILHFLLDKHFQACFCHGLRGTPLHKHPTAAVWDPSITSPWRQICQPFLILPYLVRITCFPRFSSDTTAVRSAHDSGCVRKVPWDAPQCNRCWSCADSIIATFTADNSEQQTFPISDGKAAHTHQPPPRDSSH